MVMRRLSAYLAASVPVRASWTAGAAQRVRARFDVPKCLSLPSSHLFAPGANLAFTDALHC